MRLSRAAKVGIVVGALGLWSHGSVALSAVYLTVEIEPARAQVGEAVSVRYSVRIRDQGGVRIMPLNFGTLQLLSDSSPPQVPMMWGTGFGFSIDTANEYVVRASRPGRYVISGGRAVDPQTGRVVAQAAPVTLVVGDVPAVDPDAGVIAGDPDASAEAPVDPDAPPNGDMTGAFYDMVGFFRVGVDRPRVYLGEQVMFRVWAYSSSPDAGCELTEEPTFPGFWNESAFAPTRECAQRWFSQQVNGRFMAIGLVRKWALFASQTGVQRFGSVAGRIDVMSGGMFRQVRRSESRTPQAEVEVIEPPVDGRPEGYVPGTIGPIVLDASIDRDNCSTGETATVTVRARSEGSLASAQLLFERNVDGARVRSAEGRTVIEASATGRFESVRTTEVLVVPERAGTIALGEARIPYWDPGAQRYAIARVALPSVRATGDSVTGAAQSAAQEDPAHALRPPAAAPRLRGYAPWFVRVGPALAVSLSPSLTALGLFAGLTFARWRKRAKSEQLTAEKNDPESLVRAALAALSSDEKEACSLASRAIDRALSELRESEVSVTPELEALVRDARASLESVRFAGVGSAREAVDRAAVAVRNAVAWTGGAA
jgi:hypothetical protein